MSLPNDEIGRADENPATGPDQTSTAAAEGDVASSRRAFRGWGAAQSGAQSVVSRMRHSLSTLFVPPELADTLPPETPRPEIPAALAGKTGEIHITTDEFEVHPLPLAEQPTAPLPHPWRAKLDKLARLLTWWRAKPAPVAAPAAETVVGGHPVFLYTKFRAFYNEIIRFRHQRTEFAAGFATALLSEAETLNENPATAAETLSRKLFELLELQAAEAKWMGGEMAERYPDAQFAMAALADEIFAHCDWDGRAAWSSHLLEPRLFRTHGAAYELFNRIDRLLKDAPNTPVSRDLARVYLLVIAAGFQGKYRPFGLTRALAEYRQRLYEYIYRDDARMLYAPERRIVPEIAARTLEGHAVSRVSAARRWAAILALIAVGYTLVAHVAWNGLAADLADVTGRIVADPQAERR